MILTLSDIIWLALTTAFAVGVGRRFPTDLAQFRASFDNPERLSIGALWAAGLFSAAYAAPKILAILSQVQVVRGSGGG